jgi:hypothetical protein
LLVYVTARAIAAFLLETVGRRASIDNMSAKNSPNELTAASHAPPPQKSTLPTNTAVEASPSFPQFSASTTAILERIHGRASDLSSSAAFEPMRAEILQHYVTSDKLPTASPIMNSGRRGKGGRLGTPSTLRDDVGVSPANGSSGRGPGRGGRSGRGGKQKRDESEEDEDEDVSVCIMVAKTASDRL